MKNIIRLALAFVCLTVTAQAQIPSTTGWYPIPNTHLRDVCPPNGFGGSGYDFTGFCSTVIDAWNGGVMDTTRNRLIIWGGGHTDYYGNELYALNLNTLVLSRITDPGLPLASPSPCQESIVNGTQPNSRHTYGGLTYLPTLDKMFVFGGAMACSIGVFSDGTWLFNFGTNQWEAKNPTGTIPQPQPGIVTAYDPNTGKVFLHDLADLYTYTPSTNTYVRLTNNGNYSIDYNMTAAIDPVRKKFVILGGGQAWVYNIGGSTFTKQPLSTTGGSAIINAGYPGVAYDSTRDRIVAWSGGNAVYELNLDTNTWSSTSFSGGPGTSEHGVLGRWQYSPATGVFVTINDVDLNATTVRLNAGAPPPPDTTPPTVSMTAPANGTTVSGSVPVSANASDNVGVVGVQFKLDGNNLGNEDTSSPYSLSWDTTTASNANHSLTAVARDLAGNPTTATAITVTVSNTAPPPPPPTTARATYPFSEGAGLATADTSGNANNGTLVNGPLWTTGGKYGNAISFDGVNDYVSAPDSSTLDLGATGTIEAWVKFDTLNRWHGIMAKGNANNDAVHNYALEINSSNKPLCIFGNGSSARQVTSGTSITAGAFIHFACTWDGSTIRLYINGVLNTSGSQTFVPGANASLLYIGQYGGNADRLDGIIDEVRIYDRARSATEIQSDMNTALASGGPPPAPDTTAPVVAITFPVGGSTVFNTITISTNASDNVGVVGVQFKVDSTNLGAEDATAPYSVSWDTTQTMNATHSLAAVGRDAAGNTGVSGITVTVNNTAPPPPPPPPMSGTMPSLADEKATYTRWGWTWSTSQEPSYSSAGNYSVSNPDIHGDTEGDDLWSYLNMYRRTNQQGYLQRANAWASYFKSGYRTCAGSSDQTFCYDLNGFGADHMYGWGLMDLYRYNNDTAALAEAQNLGAVVEALYGPSSTYGCYPSGACMWYNVRAVGRHLNLVSRLAGATSSQRWIALRDKILNLVMMSGQWNSQYGFYFWGDWQTDSAVGSGTYASGIRVASPFEIGNLAEGMWQAYKTTGRADIRARLVAMARFVQAHGLDNPAQYTGYRFGVNASGASVHYGTSNPVYTTDLVNLLVMGYKLSGDTTLLARAKTHFNRGTKGEYGTGNRLASDTQVHHFVDTKFDTSSGSFYLDYNKGELYYTYLIFENGGLPTVE